MFDEEMLKEKGFIFIGHTMEAHGTKAEGHRLCKGGQALIYVELS
jgi:hypothetical protein